VIQNNPTNVSAAIEMLLEEVEAEIEFFNGLAKKAIEERDFERVREAIAHAEEITGFRNTVAELQGQWEALAEKVQVGEEEEKKIDSGRRNLGRLRRGLRTPEPKFRLPILKALAALGGTGSVADVLARVEPTMKAVLKKVDYQPLASDPTNLRWRNTAAWSRNILVREGLLKEVERRGTWEITDKGRALLAGDEPKLPEPAIAPPVLGSPGQAMRPIVLVPEEPPHIPQTELRLPILQVLVSMGGSGSTGDVLDRVERAVHDRLTSFDREITDTHASEPRWRLSAKWCRKRMKDDGLVAKDSPHGTWEITGAGRKMVAAAR